MSTKQTVSDPKGPRPRDPVACVYLFVGVRYLLLLLDIIQPEQKVAGGGEDRISKPWHTALA